MIIYMCLPCVSCRKKKLGRAIKALNPAPPPRARGGRGFVKNKKKVLFHIQVDQLYSAYTLKKDLPFAFF